MYTRQLCISQSKQIHNKKKKKEKKKKEREKKKTQRELNTISDAVPSRF